MGHGHQGQWRQIQIFRTREVKNRLEYEAISRAQFAPIKLKTGGVIWGEAASGTVSGTEQALGQGTYVLVPKTKADPGTN